jgi:uncharacterized protein (DUF433 family)
MKTTIKLIPILALLVISVVVANPALAEDETPPVGGPLSDLMVSAFAAETGLSVTEVQNLVDDGWSLIEIAKDLGYTEADIKDLMEGVGDAALGLAVDQGMITQEQADKIANRERVIGNSSLAGKFFERMGLTPEEVVSLLDSGMTFHEIALKQGLEFGGFLAERCGLSRDAIIARLDAGETLREICPGIMIPAGGWLRGNQP